MKLSRIKTMLLVVTVAATMLFSSTAVFAAVNADTTEPKITKNVAIADGVTLADTTVTFNVSQVTPYKDGAGVEYAAPATIEAFDVTGTVSSTNKTAEVELGVAAKIAAAGNKPGQYMFDVRETAPTQGTNWTTVDSTVYLLQVLVDNAGAYKYSVTKKDANVDNANTDKTDLIFKNVYEATAYLIVSKAVTGDDYVPTDTEYEFTVAFTANGDLAKVPEKVSGRIGSADATEYTVTDNKVVVKLKKGETITFTGLPAGIKYTVTETTPTVQTYKDTTITQKADGETVMSDQTATATQIQTLGNKGENSVAVTNNFTPIAPTGLIMSYLPYISMIALAIAAVALYLVSKRREAARR